jgi:molecular chaperone DnaK (HSP70)
MPYVLGIDLGAARTFAAACRLGAATPIASGWSEPEVVPLGAGTAGVASRLRLLPDGSLRAAYDDHHGDSGAVCGFAGRVGDDVPLVLDHERVGGQMLLAGLAAWVARRAQAREGTAAQRVVVCHPAGWAAYRADLLSRSLERAGLQTATLLPAPVAAAHAHAADLPADTESTLAVLDLRGGEVSVVRGAVGFGFELLGHADCGLAAEADGYPGGLEPLLDDALLDHVSGRLGLRLEALDHTDPATRDGLVRLREECAAARQRLNTTGEASVAVDLPQTRTRATVARAEFEEAVRPLLATAVESLARTVRSCGLSAGDLAAVLLVGESAATPLAQRIVTAALPGRLAVAGEPELTTARGAAVAAGRLAHAPDRPARALVGDRIYRAGDRIHRAGGRGDEADGYAVAGVDASDGYGQGDRYGVAEYDADEDYRPSGAAGRGATTTGRDDPTRPPPRPPVEISPLNLPRRGPGRHLSRRPSLATHVLLTLAGTVILGIAVFLALAL